MNKPPEASYQVLLLCYFCISLLGLILLAMLTFTFPLPSTEFLKKPFIITLFTAICLLGIKVSVSPPRCSWRLHGKEQDEDSHNNGFNNNGQRNREVPVIRFQGHHPTCGNFSAHIIKLMGKTYCAGCSGLATGAIISLFGIFLYSFLDFSSGETFVLLFWVGFIAVVCGLLQYWLPKWNRGIAHFLINVTFVIGPFLLLVAINEITGNFLLELYLFALILYWITARIMMSQLEHKRICKNCGLKSCNCI